MISVSPHGSTDEGVGCQQAVRRALIAIATPRLEGPRELRSTTIIYAYRKHEDGYRDEKLISE